MDTALPHLVLVVPMRRVEHLDAALVAAYLENACEVEERRRVEEHLAACAECTAELVGLDDTIRALSTRKRGRVAIPLVAFGVAAGIGALIVLRPPDVPAPLPSEVPPIVQRSRPEARSSIEVLEPAPGAIVAEGEVVLRWAPIEVEARYLVTVTTSDGDSVWALLTPDSAAAIPVPLDPGGEYLWYVDALLPGGSTASSGVHHFQVPQ
ncbi:MAG TPA: zf-HC2 domain-containing protein [Longimicrobiaceae bacterium]|nr:zf-HC2 domain-containing protein [Longimicrobiaceae bacterium]